MAKATITIEDNADGEATDISIHFDPPIDNRDGNAFDNATKAQRIAIGISAALHRSDPDAEMSVNGQ